MADADLRWEQQSVSWPAAAAAAAAVAGGESY